VSCLALNASFEPLTIVTTRRAVRLVLDGKAELLESDSERVFRSEDRVVPCPAVIRLVRYVHVPYRFRRQVTNTFLFARDDYTCQYCGRRRSELRGRQFLTRDHVRPLSRGGLNTWENVVTSCSTCNNRKGGRLPSEAGLALLHEPTEPNYVHLVWVVRRVTDAQAKYIKMFYGEDALEAVRPSRGHRAREPLTLAETELAAAQSSSQA
jgi:5-methylcytosine-specific restriction endonuclease McrA